MHALSTSVIVQNFTSIKLGTTFDNLQTQILSRLFHCSIYDCVATFWNLRGHRVDSGFLDIAQLVRIPEPYINSWIGLNKSQKLHLHV